VRRSTKLEVSEVTQMNNEQELVHEFADPAEQWADIMEDDLAAMRHRRDDDGGEGGLASASPSAKVFAIVAEIVRHGVEHDYQDVLEHGVDGVLALYGIGGELAAGERELLREELLALGERVQTREMAMSAQREDSLLQGLRQRTWSPREEAAFRKAFIAALRAERGRKPLGAREGLGGLASRTGSASGEAASAARSLVVREPARVELLVAASQSD
jgi:hypothetical protein